ncbi:MAG: ornithine cyclodeaminase family protein [Alphaproteobacteria bacterium]
MHLIDARAVADILTEDVARAALADAFRAGATEAPPRHVHDLDGGTLLLMPAWDVRAVGVKLVTVVPGNAARGLPAVHAQYLLSDRATGRPLALIDGEMLTLRRTAAASALASSFLSRPDSRHLVMVGAGALAPHVVAAHCAVRPIARVTIWNRTAERARALAARLDRPGLHVAVADDLEAAVQAADIVSCATLSTTPLVRGAWLRPGTHLDLIGGFRPDMREVDDDAVVRSTLFVDTRPGALAEAGDLVQPIAAGLIAATAVRADLAALCRGTAAGRTGPAEITLFKSVGAALEDLAAALVVHDRVGGSHGG